MSIKLLRFALAAALVVTAVGCNKDQPPATTAAVAPSPSPSPSSAAPDVAVLASVKALKSNNIDALIQNTLPPGDYQKFKTEWTKKQDEVPVSDEDRQKFAEGITKLTAPDAEQKLWVELEPKLKEMDAQMAQQMPMMIAMGKGFAQSSIQQNQDLTEAQKTQANQAIDAFGNWVQTAKFTDPALAQKAIAVVCDTARKVGLKTLDEARALNYDQAMQKANVVFAGVKQLFDIYGFSIDKLLDSVKAETLSNDGTSAKIKVSYMLFTTPLSAETDLVKVDNRWYGKNALEQLRKKQQESDAGQQPKISAPEPTSDNG